MLLRESKDGRTKIGGMFGEQDTWGTLRMKEKFAELTICKNLDFACCRPPRKIDRFSKWVATTFISFWHEYVNIGLKPLWHECVHHLGVSRTTNIRIPSAIENGDPGVSPSITQPFLMTTHEREDVKMIKYSQNRIIRVTSIITTFIASLLPMAAIHVLTRFHEKHKLLGCITGFVAIFAFCLELFGNAKRIKIFSATAAYVIASQIRFCSTDFLQGFRQYWWFS